MSGYGMVAHEEASRLGRMYNATTGELERFNGNYKDYLPQLPSVMDEFDSLVAQGARELDAFIYVLGKCVGETK